MPTIWELEDRNEDPDGGSHHQRGKRQVKTGQSKCRQPETQTNDGCDKTREE
jgi:hypothetical protein